MLSVEYMQGVVVLKSNPRIAINDKKITYDGNLTLASAIIDKQTVEMVCKKLSRTFDPDKTLNKILLLENGFIKNHLFQHWIYDCAGKSVPVVHNDFKKIEKFYLFLAGKN